MSTFSLSASGKHAHQLRRVTKPAKCKTRTRVGFVDLLNLLRSRHKVLDPLAHLLVRDLAGDLRCVGVVLTDLLVQAAAEHALEQARRAKWARKEEIKDTPDHRDRIRDAQHSAYSTTQRAHRQTGLRR